MRYCMLKNGIAQIPASHRDHLRSAIPSNSGLESTSDSFGNLHGRTGAWEFITRPMRMQEVRLPVFMVQTVTFSSTQSTPISDCEEGSESGCACLPRRMPA